LYDLSFTPEQIEFRDTVRDFVENEVKPAALDPQRLEPFEKPLLLDALAKASRMGLRALALPVEAGGAGADLLTGCLVFEELGAGDVDLAVVLWRTMTLADALFNRLAAPEQRERFLAPFLEDDRYHLACAAHDPADGLGWCYHRPLAQDPDTTFHAVKQGDEWVINGSAAFVANAPLAKLFVVEARTDPEQTGARGLSAFLVPRESPGLAVGEPYKMVGERIRWHHGSGAGIALVDCRVPAAHLLGRAGASPLASGQEQARALPLLAAVNLGVARAAFAAAVDYAKIRRQGGRHIIEHPAIGAKLADCAIKLELARGAIWKAAWALDHPQAAAQDGAVRLPLETIARVVTAEAAHEVTLAAAECFGAMGVMRDMPLQKYVHDAMVFLHSDDADGAARLAVAEAIAGYRRPVTA
jgi:alkylation response protein AidB-like acyl-CoA dehydrogenase